MLGDVEPLGLLVGGDPQPDGGVDGLGQQEGYDEGPHQGGAHGQQLLPEQGEAAPGEQPVGAEGVDAGVGEEPEEQRAQDPADQVDAHHVEGVVVAEPELELDGQEADHAGDEPDDDGRHGPDEPGAGGDGHQPGDGAGRGAEGG